MWAWSIAAYVVLLSVLTGCAGYVALFVADQQRRELAYKVLKTALAAVTGCVSVFTLVIRLHQAGLV